jgi:ligand-binding sensor domain-containing protein
MSAISYNALNLTICGNFWIGTYAHGLYLFDPRTRKTVNFNRKPGSKNSLPHNDVRDFIVLPSGHLWIATWGGGLSLFDLETGKFRNFKSEDFPGLTGNFIFTLLPENNHTLWLGTKEGLCSPNLHSLQFETVPIDTDYPGKTIQSLLKDKHGNIWAGTKKGILRLRKKKRRAEFLPGIYDNFSINSAYRDEARKLYFGADKRVVAFLPRQIRFDTCKLPVYLTDFLLFNKPVPDGLIKLKWEKPYPT